MTMPLSKFIAANPLLAGLRHTRLSARAILSFAESKSIILSGILRALAPNAVEGSRNALHRPYRPNLSTQTPRFHASTVVRFLVVLSLLPAPLHAFRNPDPPQRLPLTQFGFQAVSERYLLQGATMVTVHFVDNRHLLVTFGVSKLMPRLPDCPADDEDRTVKAVLLELPSGRELASTEWRFHDLGQYLWNLGDGHFLLRNRDTLTTFIPLEGLAANASGGPFAQTPFLHFTRRIEAILISADRDLLAIETIKPKAHAATDPMLQVSAQTSPNPAPPTNPPGLQRRDPNAAPPDAKTVEVTFLHLARVDNNAFSAGELQAGAQTSSIRIVPQLLARIRTEKVVNIPLTTEGFLETRTESRNGVLFHFITYAGKDIDLGDFPTSCHPRPTFVSKSEFVTYGCRGSDESPDLAGFNLRGDMIWQINFTDTQAYPSFASVPAVGRFAFSRTITTTNVFGSETPSASQLTAQEIRVIQMYNGKQLVRAVASPIQRVGQNYALSPDGLTLAVIHDAPAPPAARGEKPLHDTAVELYKLPALTPKDLAAIKTEADMAPPPAKVPMRFSMKEIQEGLTANANSSDADAKIVGDRIQTATSSQSPADRSPDAHIVGDPPPPGTQAAAGNAKSAATAAPQVPTADPAPACANLSETSVAACQTVSKSATTEPAKSAAGSGSDDPEAGKRRKPPTLYEPAPATAPKEPQP